MFDVIVGLLGGGGGGGGLVINSSNELVKVSNSDT